MKTIFTGLLLFLTLSIQAQRAEWLKYSRALPLGSGYSSISLIAADPHKNCYTYRDFIDGYIIDNDTVAGIGGVDMSIIKTDSSGNYVWNKVIGTTGNDNLFDIQTDNDSNLYITGFFESINTITNDTSYATTINSNQIIKIGADGRFIRTFVATEKTLITIHGKYIYGVNTNSVFKLDSAFNLIWIKNFTPNNILSLNIGNGYRNRIATNGHYLAFSGNETFGNSGPVSIDTVNISFSGTQFDQFFVVLMDTSGAALWSRSSDPTNASAVAPVGTTVDNQGNVYLAAASSSDFVFGSTTVHVNGGFETVGVLKYNSIGNPLWAKEINTTGHMTVTNLKGDASGNVIVIGNHSGIVTAGSASSNNVTSGSYVVGYNSSGAMQFTKYNSSGPSNGSITGLDIHPSGDFWIGGLTNATTSWDCIDIDPGFAHPSYWGRFTMSPVVFPQATFSYNANNNVYSFTNQSLNTDSIHWDFGDGTSSNQSNPVHTFTNGQNYTVILTVYYGICTDTDTLNIVGVGISETAAEDQFSIYPVPAKEYVMLHASIPSSGLKIQLCDLSGKVVLEEIWQDSETDKLISTEKLANGFYLLHLNESHQKTILQLVVQH